MQDKKGELGSIFRALVLLAIPMICQNFITYGVVLADNLMVGQLEHSINGLYLAGTVQLVLHMVLIGIESAMSVLATQYWGRRAVEPIKDIVAICARAAALVAIPVFAVTCFLPESFLGFLTTDADTIAAGARYLRLVSPSYLLFAASSVLVSAMRSIEVVRIGLINAVVAFVLNVGLNYLLIFGHAGLPALGVGGAAIATDVSRLVELGIVLAFVLRFETSLRLRLRDFARANRVLARDLVRYGAPLMAGQIVWAVNKFTMRWIVGHFSKEAATAASIAETLDGLLWVGTVGLASSMAIQTGKMIGAGRIDLVKTYARRMQLVFAAIGVASFFVVRLGGGIFLSFYSLQPETVETARLFLAVLAFAVAGRSYQAPCLMGLVKAGGDTSFVFKNDTFWVFCWVLPSALVANLRLHAPDWAVYALLLSDQVTKCFVAFVKINRFRWMKNLTRSAAGLNAGAAQRREATP